VKIQALLSYPRAQTHFADQKEPPVEWNPLQISMAPFRYQWESEKLLSCIFRILDIFPREIKAEGPNIGQK